MIVLGIPIKDLRTAGFIVVLGILNKDLRIVGFIIVLIAFIKDIIIIGSYNFNYYLLLGIFFISLI